MSRGGFGVKDIRLNHPVPLSEEAMRISRTPSIECDIYCPSARADIEYHGRKAHETWERRERDMERQDALSSMGILVVHVAKRQLYDFSKIEALAALILRRQARTLRYRLSDGNARQRALHRQIMQNMLDAGAAARENDRA